MNFARHWSQKSFQAELVALMVVLLIIEAFALPLGWLNAGRTAAWPTGIATVYWIGAGMLNLVVYEVGTRSARLVMKPWQPSLIPVLIGGTLLGTPFLEIGKHFYAYGFQMAFIEAELWQPLPANSPLIMTMQRQVLNVALWVLINVVLVHYHGLRRFGFVRFGKAIVESGSGARSDPPPQASNLAAVSPRVSQPAFMTRVRKPLGQIWAFAAEEHYLRIIGELGEEIILYRISDAISEMEDRVPGARVHRSYWVASGAVIGNEKTRSGHALILPNDMRIPVSRGFHKATVEAGLL